MTDQIGKRVICALDTTSVEGARLLARQLKPHVGAIKLGLEFFSACGRDGFAEIAATGSPIFLDLKLHDIPNTVAKAIHALVSLKPFMMTVHASGGADMLKAAAKAASEAAAAHGVPRPLMLGVTVLTSMDDNDLARVGVQGDTDAQVERLALLAQNSGLDGVICSPREISRLRNACGRNFRLVVPGIRPAGAALGDQKRVMTPGEAVALGADYLVIGRPITEAADAAAAAADIAASLSGISV